MSGRSGETSHVSRHAAIVERLGLDITSGELSEGLVVRSEELAQRYAVTRSVLREGLRVLETLGMVTSRRNVGVSICPDAEWNVFDPLVIRWRLAGSGRGAQLRSLTELRSAVEPLAAKLAATRIADDDGRKLLELAARLVGAADAGDLDAFLPLDIEFHALILRASGNEMLRSLESAIGEVLTGRTHHGLMPTHPEPEARRLHLEVAKAVAAGEPAKAHAAMQRIVDLAGEEIDAILD
ncbi:MAG TPA: FCD domain-containing protein [Arthrobacter sp.]|jgi:DNA-binding FadR family transcriptional regulator